MELTVFLAGAISWVFQVVYADESQLWLEVGRKRHGWWRDEIRYGTRRCTQLRPGFTEAPMPSPAGDRLAGGSVVAAAIMFVSWSEERLVGIDLLAGL
ncbi:hypothetical protein ACI2LF_31985 [Kribbella sp. NPDC020789]